MNNKRWILKTKTTKEEQDSFPYAFRNMFMRIKKFEMDHPGQSNKSDYSIVSPFGKSYSYNAAKELALAQGLLSPDGQINGKEFKRK